MTIQNTLLDSTPNKAINTSPMTGFDPEFTDIIDYILRITYRIWEGKQPDLCLDYYTHDCPVYTLAGITIGASEVTQNTVNTLASFPDRTLHAENIIWGGNDQEGFHTSHLIRSHMTNLGDSDLGPATNKEAEILVIAHCIVKNNKIAEEWLVRDNYSLVQQLGFNPIDIALKQAQQPIQERLELWQKSEIKRLKQITNPAQAVDSEALTQNPNSAIETLLYNIWKAPLSGDIFIAYSNDALLHSVSGRELQGHDEINLFYLQFLSTLSDIHFSVDYVCHQNTDEYTDIAVRWSLTGIHSGQVLYGKPTGTELYILGESQYRMKAGKIIEEWTIFDELAIWTQVFRAQAAQGK